MQSSKHASLAGAFTGSSGLYLVGSAVLYECSAIARSTSCISSSGIISLKISTRCEEQSLKASLTCSPAPKLSLPIIAFLSELSCSKISSAMF